MAYKDTEEGRENKRQYRINHRERGLCRDCARPAVKNMWGYCALHYDHQLRNGRKRDPDYRKRIADYSKQRYYRLKSEHKCPRCAVPLGEQETVYCFNCYTITKYGAIKGVL
ncbi:hypothetical protein LCGC14_1830910 [marine sediment metagenome]|uniref:Uncharacterized protein n=1 Tax=marine sediment metagenome TaxID=412755 RepID=A0A0F9IVQ1_9ZZZZ